MVELLRNKWTVINMDIVWMIKKYFRRWKINREWRRRNAHNHVSVRGVISGVFPLDHVSVGKGSYGVLQIASYNPDVEHISIGNYVSIAKNVLFMGGGVITPYIH